MIYEFEVPGKVIGKGRPRLNSYTGIVYTPTKTKDYETLIEETLEKLEKAKKSDEDYLLENAEIEQILSYIEETKDNRITLITCEENRSDYRRCVQAVQVGEWQNKI